MSDSLNLGNFLLCSYDSLWWRFTVILLCPAISSQHIQQKAISTPQMHICVDSILLNIINCINTMGPLLSRKW